MTIQCDKISGTVQIVIGLQGAYCQVYDVVRAQLRNHAAEDCFLSPLLQAKFIDTAFFNERDCCSSILVISCRLCQVAIPRHHHCCGLDFCLVSSFHGLDLYKTVMTGERAVIEARVVLAAGAEGQFMEVTCNRV